MKPIKARVPQYSKCTNISSLVITTFARDIVLVSQHKYYKRAVNRLQIATDKVNK
mgnify:CR=1 FL=1